MVSQKTIDIVKSTAPAIRERGEEITRRMYVILFEERPEYRRFFETSWMKHLDGGSQPAKLAGSVYAYATHIDRLDELEKAVEKIAHRHVDTKVISEQYPMIGECLLEAMKDVLGESATPEVMEAWSEAYQALADIFIKREKEIYSEEDKELVEEMKQHQ
ncbi:MAG: globin domain-containing protein [Chroococcales cyanobacterium]